MVLNKKIVILISFFSLFICILTLQDTYAKYTSQANGTTDITIARWRILVNDFDIKQNLTSNSIITPVFMGTEHIASDIIAPTSEGYFDIVIDANDTDVSFTFDITTDVNKNSSVKDLLITGYQVNGGDIVNISNGDTITGSINYNDAERIKTIRVYIKWNDDSSNTMNNADDTLATTGTDPTAKVDVAVHFVQKVN